MKPSILPQQKHPQKDALTETRKVMIARRILRQPVEWVVLYALLLLMALRLISIAVFLLNQW